MRHHRLMSGLTRAARMVAIVTAVVGLTATTACVANDSSLAALTLGVPERANEYASLASHGTWVAAAWSASSQATGTNVYVAVSNDGGRSFGLLVRVNAVERQASINGEQAPRVAVVPRHGTTPGIAVIWTAKVATGTVLLTARSMDGGRSFGASVSVPGTEAPGNRGWESVAADSAGHIYAAWLDHRDTVAQAGNAHAMHQHGGSADSPATDGATRAQQSQLFIGTVDQEGMPARSVARGVCYCCKTAVLAAPDGVVYAAWRHVYPGNHRDIAFTVSRDGGRSFSDPVRVSEDQWQIDGCPENGPSLAVDTTRRVYVLWPTLVTEAGRETLKLFFASTADGRVFTPRSPLPTNGAAFHAQLVTSAEGRLWAAWDEAETGTSRRVRLARAMPDRDDVAVFEGVDLSPDTVGSYPALTATPDAVVLAWTTRDNDGSSVHVLSCRGKQRWPSVAVRWLCNRIAELLQ